MDYYKVAIKHEVIDDGKVYYPKLEILIYGANYSDAEKTGFKYAEEEGLRAFEVGSIQKTNVTRCFYNEDGLDEEDEFIQGQIELISENENGSIKKTQAHWICQAKDLKESADIFYKKANEVVPDDFKIKALKSTKIVKIIQ